MAENEAPGSGPEKPASEPLFEEDDLNEAGLYDLADDPDANPPPRPKRQVPASAVPASGKAPARPSEKSKVAVAGKPKSGPPKRAPSALEAGAAMAAGRTRPMGRSEAQDKAAAKETIKMLGLVGLGIALLVVAVVVIRTVTGGSESTAGDDPEARRLVGGYEEIREWLNSGANQRTLLGHSPNQSKSRADEVYQLGAVKILAGGGIQSSRIVIELPEDGPPRRALIDWANAWHEKYGIIERMNRSDEGQSFLVVQMPLNS